MWHFTAGLFKLSAVRKHWVSREENQTYAVFYDSIEVYNWHDGNKNNFTDEQFKNNWGSSCAKT